MTFFQISLILISHFFADFIFQNDRMALGKSKSLKWLSLHVLVYTGVLFLGTGILFFREPYMWICFGVVNGMLHWVVDFFTSRLNARLWNYESKHWFFVGIGFDQLLHGLCLFGSVELLRFYNV
jgi:hypothetical protein